MSTKKTKKAILVVDDDPTYLRLLGLNLMEAGYRVIVVPSGEEALRTISMEKPGLVLLDILMPELDGFEILKRIKAIDSNIPVIMVTSVWDHQERERTFEAGCSEYITKPIDFEYLKLAILTKLLPGE